MLLIPPEFLKQLCEKVAHRHTLKTKQTPYLSYSTFNTSTSLENHQLTLLFFHAFGFAFGLSDINTQKEQSC